MSFKELYELLLPDSGKALQSLKSIWKSKKSTNLGIVSIDQILYDVEASVPILELEKLLRKTLMAVQAPEAKML